MKLVILEPLGVDKAAFLEKAHNALGSSFEITAYDDRKEDTQTLIARSKEADIVVLTNFKFGEDVISACPNLKMICVAFTGVDHVDMAYCKKRGITVCNCAGYSTCAVADLVFGLVLSLARNIPACDVAVREQKTKNGLVGFELAGKKFGVIGFGAIGSRVARIAKAFGCEVYAFNKSPKAEPDVTFTDLDTLLSTCDIVSLHVPLNDTTRGLINAQKLSFMKKNAVLVNTARGPVVDSDALLAALENATIAGAACDVFEMEPPIPKEHPLLHAPHMIVTPHVAFASAQAFEKRASIVIDNIMLFAKGTPQNVK